jgi:phosphate transport system substrate-binding protein
VTAGSADIGMTSRNLTPLGVGLSTFTVGYDGVCFVVHHSNSVQSLSNEQIREIFTGKTRRWSEVGGADAPITYIHRATGRAERSQFMEFFKVGEDDLRNCVTAGDNQQALAAVLENANAIVYMSLGIAQNHSDASNPVVKILPLEGITATQENIRTGKYPLVRPLNLVVKGEPNRLQKDLINFTLSREGQDCIRVDHFVPVAK